MTFYDYWNLENVKWNNGRGIQDLITFGISPIRAITDIIDDETGGSYSEKTQDTVHYLNIAVRNMLQNMESCIYRFLEEGHEQSVGDSKEVTKPKSIFEDPRFSEYVAQIKIDGHDPVDILESWLKEHNPEFLEDD